MSRSPVRPPLNISIEDRQCDCLGSTSQSQQYFLQHKNLEIKSKAPPILTARHPTPANPLSNAIKRSLKKSLKGSYESPVTARSIEPLNEYYSPKKIEPSKLSNQRGSKQIEERRSAQVFNAEKAIKRTESTPIEHLFRDSLRGDWQHSTPNMFFTSLSPTLSPSRPVPTQKLQPPIKINFSHSPPPSTLKHSPLPSPRDFIQLQREQEIKKPPTLSQFKQQMKINIPTHCESPSKRDGSLEVIDFQLTEDNMDTPRNLPTDRKRSNQKICIEEPSPPHPQQALTLNDYFPFGETFKSRIEKPKSNKKQQNPYKSKIQTSKSKIETAKSRVQTKRSVVGDVKTKVKSLRDDKISLRKMDDVEEIRSMVDSQEKEDDKESVVLGRLNEYGSVGEPSLSLTSPSLRSKLISMNTLNTQSSITAKSFLRPFQFNIDRSHFK